MATGNDVNVDIALEVVQKLGKLCEEFVLYFPEIIKTNLDLVKKLTVIPVENVAARMQDELINLCNDSGANYMFGTYTICDFLAESV